MSESPQGRVYVLRHGETAWSRDGRHTSRTEVDLTAEGHHQARVAGRLLDTLRGSRDGTSGPATVWCSPRRRARDTAAGAGLSCDAIVADLVEWDYGEYEGRTTPDIRNEVEDWTVWTHACPGGESATAVGERAERVLAEAEEVLVDGDLVLVGHGHAGRVLIARYLGLDPAAGVGFAFDPASVTVLGHERGVARIDLLNVPGGLVEPPPPPAERH